MKKPLTLSIIIPAYNEECHLKRCLDSIAKQTELPDEVIVVDNNSIDKTAEIARSYEFVTLLKEKKQGIISARNRGMNSAKGDILARIDADVALDADWTHRAKKSFSDQNVMGVAGVARSYSLPFFGSLALSTIWTRGYLLWMRIVFNVPIMFGANMLVRRSAWKEIFPKLSLDDWAVHEDQDISVVLASLGHYVIENKKLLVQTDSVDKAYWPKYTEYVLRMRSTLKIHKQNNNLRNSKKYYTPLQRLTLVLLLFVPIKLLFLIIMTINTPILYFSGGHDRFKPDIYKRFFSRLTSTSLRR